MSNKTLGDVAEQLGTYLYSHAILFTGNASEWVHSLPIEKQNELLTLTSKIVGVLRTKSVSDVEEASKIAFIANISLLCQLADALPLVEWAATVPELQEHRNKVEYATFAEQFTVEPEGEDLLLHAMAMLSAFTLAIAEGSKVAATLRIIGGTVALSGFTPFSDPEQSRPLNPTEQHEALATNFAALLPVVLPFIRLIAEIPPAERVERLSAVFPTFTIRQNKAEQ